jgi:hypothetical protein
MLPLVLPRQTMALVLPRQTMALVLPRQTMALVLPRQTMDLVHKPERPYCKQSRIPRDLPGPLRGWPRARALSPVQCNRPVVLVARLHPMVLRLGMDLQDKLHQVVRPDQPRRMVNQDQPRPMVNQDNLHPGMDMAAGLKDSPHHLHNKTVPLAADPGPFLPSLASSAFSSSAVERSRISR